ncbi:isocitrate lyase/PEP mutase family protein [Pseudonocardia alni]|uniref:isocitrate lyase/PEP mutase family protein n=1 Tax=Pseudonocardia alni TaxID=33907 RepID=UPI00280C0AFF|nr:isocitrate lyase/PEP mutase family protein [Pseudonocardia alni]
MNDGPAQLRRILTGAAMVRAPGVFDGLSAHLARRAGFDAVYLTGAGIAASTFGLPDVGLTTATEMVSAAERIVEAARLPVIADADTGYGNALNVTRTVRAYERAGVAAVQLEDQTFPKRCGHLSEKEVIDVDEFLRKLDAALRARVADTVVIARTDAGGPLGIDAAIERAGIYAANGADLVFIEAPRSRREIERVSAEVPGPLVFNVVPSGRTPVMSDAELEKLGFRLAIYPAALLIPVARTIAEELWQMGGAPPTSIDGPADLFSAVGLDDWAALDDAVR